LRHLNATLNRIASRQRTNFHAQDINSSPR